MSLGNLLPDRVTHLRPPAALTRDQSGGIVDSPADRQEVATGVACQVNVLSAAQAIIYRRAQMRITHELVTEYSAVENGDVLKLEDDNTILRVRAVNAVRAQGTLGTYYEIQAERIRN